jgi:hypothetical protein
VATRLRQQKVARLHVPVDELAVNSAPISLYSRRARWFCGRSAALLFHTRERGGRIPAEADRGVDRPDVDRHDPQAAGHHPARLGGQPPVLAGTLRRREFRAAARGLARPVRRAGRAGHREGQAVRARRADEGHLEEGRQVRRRPDAGRVVRRPPDRVVWKDRQWQWAALRYENGSFDTPNYTDTYARDKWFFQAIAASPQMFRRDAGAGSLYWLGLRDNAGAYLDGGKAYKLTVPQPVPGKLFWSVTVYDAETRSQVQTDQGKAALRSLVELTPEKVGKDAKEVDLYFGPKAPARRGAGSRRSPARAGSSTSASTARRRPRSTVSGSRATSRK